MSKRVDCATEIRLLKQCQGHPNVVQLIDVLQVLLFEFFDILGTLSVFANFIVKYIR